MSPKLRLALWASRASPVMTWSLIVSTARPDLVAGREDVELAASISTARRRGG
jgi:hypothetical protein